MPFTLSHAAAVLPAVRADGTGRARLIPAVLIAGSFSPDLTYYAASVVAGAMEFGEVTHSFAGVFTVDVLITWALVALWLLLREPLVALLPRARQPGPATLLRCGTRRARLSPALAARWYASAVVGALTHVVWDAFTHLDRWGMRVFPALADELAGAPLYWYLQYGGSAVAAMAIVGFLVRAVRDGGAGRGAPGAEGAVLPAGSEAVPSGRAALSSGSEAVLGGRAFLADRSEEVPGGRAVRPGGSGTAAGERAVLADGSSAAPGERAVLSGRSETAAAE
ncbi:DUF4184 family protein, partial [Streptomyces sp. NPDC094437]|uniref:DUF4184 family protein n=1 Tax=Streptomyces sp. NPDC094437 TaxID=3366060 RepID=UPI0037FBE608